MYEISEVGDLSFDSKVSNKLLSFSSPTILLYCFTLCSDFENHQT